MLNSAAQCWFVSRRMQEADGQHAVTEITRSGVIARQFLLPVVPWKCVIEG